MKILVLAILAIFGLAAFAQSASNSVYWTVPAGASKIQVISRLEGATVLDRTFNVEPGQTFKVQVVE